MQKFWEIVDPKGKKFIIFDCDSCKERHVVQSKMAPKLRRAFKNAVEIELWCGKGEKPKLETGDGLRMLLKVEPELKKKTLEFEIYEQILDIERKIKSAYKGYEEKFKTIKDIIEEEIRGQKHQIERLNENIEFNDDLLVELERLKQKGGEEVGNKEEKGRGQVKGRVSGKDSATKGKCQKAEEGKGK